MDAKRYWKEVETLRNTYSTETRKFCDNVMVCEISGSHGGEYEV